MFSNSCRYKIFNATNALNKRLNCNTPSAEAQQKTTQIHKKAYYSPKKFLSFS